MNKTNLTKYFLELRQKLSITPTLKWYIVESVPTYSNITKQKRVCNVYTKNLKFRPSETKMHF